MFKSKKNFLSNRVQNHQLESCAFRCDIVIIIINICDLKYVFELNMELNISGRKRERKLHAISLLIYNNKIKTIQ